MKDFNLKKQLIYLIKAGLAFLTFFIGKYIQLLPITIFNIKKIDNKTQVLLSLFSNIFIILILILLYRKDLIKQWKKFKDNYKSNFDIGFNYWIIGVICMALSNIIINFIFKGNGATNEKIVQEMISSLPLVMFINAGIIGPIIEELTFRQTFKTLISNKWIFILTSGIIFGSLHVITSYNSPLDLLYIIPYSSLGIAFALMYEKTDTVFTSIIMHMIHNTILTLFSFI